MTSTKKQPTIPATATGTDRAREVLVERTFPLSVNGSLVARVTRYETEQGEPYVRPSLSLCLTSKKWGTTFHERYWFDLSPNARAMLLDILAEGDK